MCVCLCERGVEEIYLSGDFHETFPKYTFSYALSILKLDFIHFINLSVTKEYWSNDIQIPSIGKCPILIVDQTLQTGI